MDTRTKPMTIGYAPPINRFEKWRARTWPRWATRLWPIRRGPVLPILYDPYAFAARVYFLSSDGPYVLGADGARLMGKGASWMAKGVGAGPERATAPQSDADTGGG